MREYSSADGTTPVAMDLLMISVITGSSSSWHCLKSFAGRGSRSDDLEADVYYTWVYYLLSSIHEYINGWCINTYYIYII